ncbi:MAG: hypothetical protein JNL58_30770 [Planctomyces sp.]|nr:hypothetical protein [Planctomyces sp.]
MNKRKRTSAEKRNWKKRKANFKIIFINGKQKRVPREPMIHGMPVDEFLARNADLQWLHETEQWELIPQDSVYVRPKFSDSGAVDQPKPNQDVIDKPSDHQQKSDESDSHGFDSIPF